MRIVQWLIIAKLLYSNSKDTVLHDILKALLGYYVSLIRLRAFNNLFYNSDHSYLQAVPSLGYVDATLKVELVLRDQTSFAQGH